MQNRLLDLMTARRSLKMLESKEMEASQDDKEKRRCVCEGL